MTGSSCGQHLNAALRRCLVADPSVYIWGEDIVDPYGGAFKVTAGLSTEFPGRVMPTPISEAAIVGMGVGAAVRGLRPVVEIMFGDFLLLAADQLINHAAKFGGMYNGGANVPLVVRTPMGGGRGYGTTHSQTLEKHFLGVPGLRVVAPSHFLSPGEVLETAVLRDPMPVLFIENKLLYSVPVHQEDGGPLHVDVLSADGGPYPWVRVRNYDSRETTPDLTTVTYGGVSRLLAGAMEHLAEEEIWVEAFLPVELGPSACDEVFDACRRTRRVLLIEESTAGFGWTAEVARGLAESLWGTVSLRMRSLQAAESVIPSQRGMEDAMLPGTQDVVQTLLEMLD
jgi:pyruvate/2-oxoglutarate/acetoin dehydrogenase E1 component